MSDEQGVSGEVTSEELTALLVALRNLEGEIEDLKSGLKPLADREDSIKDAMKTDHMDTEKAVTNLYQQITDLKHALQERLNAMNTDLTKIAEEAFDTRRSLRLKEQERLSLERQIEQAKRAALATAEWSTLQKRWDLLTMGAPWREWAKDHQIEGGKKITYEGRIILGDTMGLGKTLTALIACDMIEAATKDASPDHPVEFGSMK